MAPSSECSNNFDAEVAITTPEQWKYVQDDVWKVGKCRECWNKPEA
jgi:hypothetical protein